MIGSKALVIFSGGQDSTTILNWSLNRYDYVEAITFNYGQKHIVELECSKKICELRKVKQTIVDISFLNTIVESALTSNGNLNGPSNIVPNRNQLFITLAHAYLQKIGGGDLITGVCQTDYSGFPDCRRDFIDAIELATNLGSGTDIKIITPLMYLTKGETFGLAYDEGCIEDVLDLSHTCYNGNREQRHQWGWGCGDCPACILRASGWEDFKKLYNLNDYNG